MVEKITELDKQHLERYIEIISQYVSGHIPADRFVSVFLQIRRQDSYLLSGSFHGKIADILSSMFLDIDEYAPDELYDINDKFNINSDELHTRAATTLNELQSVFN